MKPFFAKTEDESAYFEAQKTGVWVGNFLGNRQFFPEEDLPWLKAQVDRAIEENGIEEEVKQDG